MTSAARAALAPVRRAYAERILALAGAAGDKRLHMAFAQTPREAFLGEGPWLVSRGAPFVAVADPAQLYADVLVALKPEEGVNNGQPSLHAHWLFMARLKRGERVVHIGAGTGYYTAILARLVGARGRVIAVEWDGELAEAAAANLAAYRNASVVRGDGAGWPREPCDLVYVNFAVDRPAPAWLDQLRPGGRLIFPLGSIGRGAGHGFGVGLMVTRVGAGGAYAAASLGPAYFVRAQGNAVIAAAGEREALLAAFEAGGFASVKSLRWRVPPTPGHALFVGEGWSLGDDPPPAG